MNRKQLIVLWSGAALLIVSWLFPPWLVWNNVRDLHPWNFIGYYFVMTLGHAIGAYYTIDWSRLVLSDLTVAGIGILLIFTLRSQR